MRKKKERQKGKLSSLSDEQFIAIVEKSNSALEVMRNIGYDSTSGGTQALIAARIKKLNIDISCFTYNRSYLPPRNTKKYELKDILIENSPYTNRSALKLRLVAEGLMQYECSLCGNDGTWNGNPLTLQLDHINGVYNDHRIENIRFLCPNCHTQTETYSGKNTKKKNNTGAYASG